MRPTSGGKSLVFNTISVCIKGVTICISPLLSLGADQSRKVIQAAHDDRSVSSFHFDKMHQSSVKALLENLKVLSPTQTVFIFTSPQAIVNRNDNLREYLIDNKLIKSQRTCNNSLHAFLSNQWRHPHHPLLLYDDIRLDR